MNAATIGLLRGTRYQPPRPCRKGLEIIRHMYPFWRPEGVAELEWMIVVWCAAGEVRRA